MPLPEHEFRRRLRMITGEFAGLLRNPDSIDSTPAEVRLYDLNFAVWELWKVFMRDHREVTFATTVCGKRLPSGGDTSADVPENTIWCGATLFPKYPGRVTSATD